MRALPLLAAALLALPASAQMQIFEPGYVVVDGQTVRGWVALGSDAENARSIAFRRTDVRDIEVLGPADIDGFGAVRGARYRSGHYAVDGPTARAFARVARDGRADLLVLWTPDGPRYYVSVDGKAPAPLAPSDGGTPSVQTALASLFADCRGTVRSVELEEDGLAREVDRFNLCTDPDYVAVGDRPTAGPPERAAVSVGIEVSAGAMAGQFVRERSGYDDPAMSAPVAAVGVRVGFATAPWLALAADLAYAREVVRVGANVTPNRVDGMDMVQVGLGLRFAPSPWVEFGAGAVVGPNPRRVLVPQADLSAEEDIVLGVFTRRLDGSVGQYAEVSLAHPAVPVGLAVRAGRTTFIGERAGVAADERFSSRSVAVTARWRLWSSVGPSAWSSRAGR